ncbi:hypothetical protein, partial [Maribacter sp. 2307ULW6-5]|uniref:hypothetical protein n=1 Tax=Maribacter sp. 2307ULW6-5 TaxID=3386275 RepID=UPI0039BC24D5
RFCYYNLPLLKQFSYFRTSRNINKTKAFINYPSFFRGMVSYFFSSPYNDELVNDVSVFTNVATSQVPFEFSFQVTD